MIAHGDANMLRTQDMLFGVTNGKGGTPTAAA